MATFQETYGGFAQGVGDVTRAGVADVGNTYVEQVLKGRSAPLTAPTGDMEYTSEPTGEAAPQGFRSALLEHYGMEQAGIRARHEAAQAQEVAQPQETPAQENSSYEPEV